MSSSDSNPFQPFAHLPGGEAVNSGATAADLLGGLRQRVAKAQQDLATVLADIEQIAGLMAQLAGETRTVGDLPGPSVY